MKPLCESLTYLIYIFIKMTRSLKTFMRNRKKEMLACGPCECRTLQCWRYANENCGCGESNWGLQPWNKTYVSGASSDMHIKLFATAPDWEDYIDVNTGGFPFITSGIFNSEWGEALVEILNSSHTAGGTENLRYTPFILWTDGSLPTDWAVGTIKTETMSLVKAVLNDPTETNKQNLINAIDASIDVIMEQWDTSASFVTYDIAGTTITILDPADSIPVWEVEQQIGAVVVTPSAETVTITSSDPSLLTVRVEKIVDAPINAYTIYGVWLTAWTATVTVTWVDDPTVSASFSINILR